MLRDEAEMRAFYRTVGIRLKPPNARSGQDTRSPQNRKGTPPSISAVSAAQGPSDAQLSDLFLREEAGDKLLIRPDSFADHYSNARMFFRSMSNRNKRILSPCQRLRWARSRPLPLGRACRAT